MNEWQDAGGSKKGFWETQAQEVEEPGAGDRWPCCELDSQAER